MTYMTASSDSKISLVMLVRYWYDFQNSEYDQVIPQSQTADNPTAPQGRAAQPSRDTRKTN